VIYFMLAAGTALSTLIVVLLAFRSVQFVTVVPRPSEQGEVAL